MVRSFSFVGLVGIVALSACARGEPGAAVVAQPTATPSVAACVGVVDAPKDGLEAVDDPALLAAAHGDPGKGALCTGNVFAATKPVTVYRVWSRAKAFTQLGRWWSFAKPVGPVDAYRAANAICTEWSELDVVSECHLKVGAHVVVGPGQSATCEKGGYPPSPTNQVFIPNDTRDSQKVQVFVEGCTAGAPWP